MEPALDEVNLESVEIDFAPDRACLARPAALLKESAMEIYSKSFASVLFF